MEWIVAFDEATAVAVITTSGMFTVTDHARMVADVGGGEQWRPGHRVLFDHRDLDFGSAGFGQMTAARDNHLAHEERIGAARSAILMKSAADYGRGRQFQLLADGALGADLRVFIDERAAWDWLSSESPAP
jgi:hypothetical protein